MKRTAPPAWTALALGALLVLAACAPTRPAAPAAPAPASPAASAPAAPLPSPAQAQPAKVILANASTGAAPQFWASYVADKQGFFAQEGIDFEAVRLQSAPNLTQSLISGDTQAVGFTVLSMATAIAAGAPLKMVVSTQDAPAIEPLYNDMVTKRLLPRDLRPNRTAIENILTIAHQQGALPEIPPLDSWIDLSYLDKASR